jgi:predicted  nucleic acid-binding Zn-ribbon protein
MTVTGEALRELHRIHRQLTDLRSRLERGPRQVLAGESSVRKLELEAVQAKESLKRARMTADDKQLHLKSREDRIEDLRTKLNGASSNKEFQTLKDQIAADEQANLVMQDEVFEALEKIDELAAKLTTCNDSLSTVQIETAKTSTRVKSEQGQLESELARVQAELLEAEKGLPEEISGDYHRMAKARGEGALSQVDGEVCGGCFQTLTTQMMNLLYLSKPIFCPNCGAMMYLAEGRKVGD